MTSTTFFIIFIPILAIILLAVNLILAPHNPYQEKDSVFECGFHSFLGQNRTQFSVSFFIFGLLFLLFDLEILLVYPYSVSSYTNDIYGLVIMMVFFVLLTLGFIFELGKNALTIDSRQTSSYNNEQSSTTHVNLGGFGLTIWKDRTYWKQVDTTFYIEIPDGDKVKLVPVVTKGEFGIEIDLTKPIYKGEAIINNEEDSAKAVQKARKIFEKIDTCSCNFVA
jgi:NADH-ubiquinone oxidoreductase chain 3